MRKRNGLLNPACKDFRLWGSVQCGFAHNLAAGKNPELVGTETLHRERNQIKRSLRILVLRRMYFGFLTGTENCDCAVEFGIYHSEKFPVELGDLVWLTHLGDLSFRFPLQSIAAAFAREPQQLGRWFDAVQRAAQECSDGDVFGC